MIKISNLSKSFGDHKVFDNINLEVKRGDIRGLIGFSGCGKSTLLKIIADLETADSGEVRLLSDRVGMAFQYSALFDSMTVAENISFPLTVGEKLEKQYEEQELKNIVAEKLSFVGLPGVQDLYPSELSGGMKKRVSFARAIVDDPEIILFDEPTAGLDPVASTLIEDLIVKFQKETNSAIIVVTHQRSTIERTTSCISMLYDTKVVWQGSPQQLYDENNNDPYAVQFRYGQVEGPMHVAH